MTLTSPLNTLAVLRVTPFSTLGIYLMWSTKPSQPCSSLPPIPVPVPSSFHTTKKGTQPLQKRSTKGPLPNCINTLVPLLLPLIMHFCFYL